MASHVRPPAADKAAAAGRALGEALKLQRAVRWFASRLKDSPDDAKMMCGLNSFSERLAKAHALLPTNAAAVAAARAGGAISPSSVRTVNAALVVGVTRGAP